MCEGPINTSPPTEHAATNETTMTAAAGNVDEAAPLTTQEDAAGRRRQTQGRRRRRQHRRPSPERVAVEVAPPIASLSLDASSSSIWEPRNCCAMTPEFIATLVARDGGLSSLASDATAIDTFCINWSTPPMIVAKRWIVVGTEQGHVCVWKADTILNILAPSAQHVHTTSLPQPAHDAASPMPSPYSGLSPDEMIDCCGLLADVLRGKRNQRTNNSTALLEPPAPIVSMATATCVDFIDQHFLVAITDTGLVAVVALGGSIDLVAGFTTNQVSATCCALTTTAAATAMTDSIAADDRHACFNIMIGYQTGQIESWEVIVPVYGGDKKNEPLRSPSPAELIFRGSLDSTCDYEIRSMAWIQPPTLLENKASHQIETILPENHPVADDVTYAAATRDVIAHLLLVMESSSLDQQLSTAAMIEVLDVQSISRAWSSNAKEQANNSASRLPKTDSPLYVEPLEAHFILAEPGMELVDVRSTANEMTSRAEKCERVRPHWIPSPATNRIIPLQDGLQIATFQANNAGMVACCLVVLSDGTAAVVSAGRVEDHRDASSEYQPSLSWGIARSQDQMIMTYPAIGLGSVQLADLEPYAVFCLGGTTTYLSPLRAQVSGTPFKTTSYPHEVDTDSPAEILHGFTAGNLVRQEQDVSDTSAVLIYAWHGGGLLDVYSCQLQQKNQNPRSIIARLVENGAVKMLCSLLFSSNLRLDETNDGGAAVSRWQSAYGELVAAGKQADSSLTVDDVCSNALATFRSLLLAFAQINDVV